MCLIANHSKDFFIVYVLRLLSQYKTRSSICFFLLFIILPDKQGFRLQGKSFFFETHTGFWILWSDGVERLNVHSIPDNLSCRLEKYSGMAW